MDLDDAICSNDLHCDSRLGRGPFANDLGKAGAEHTDAQPAAEMNVPCET